MKRAVAISVIALTALVAFPPIVATPQTLEDLYGDTGNSFQAAIGFVNFEGGPGSIGQRSYGLGVDDMFIEWFEFEQGPDETTCATGACAVMELPSSFVYDGVDALPLSLLDSTPYGRACFGGPRDGEVCHAASGDAECLPGTCLPATNDCDLDGRFDGPGDDGDCNDNGTPDVVLQADSEVEIGEVVILDRVGGDDSNEYAGTLTISTLADSAGVLFLAQVGSENPTINLTYRDHDDGTGQRCQNQLISEAQGRVQLSRDLTIVNCDVQVVGTSMTDNGDGDPYIDSSETVLIDIDVQNHCGFDLTNCVARLSSNNPEVECIKRSVVLLGTLPGATTGDPPIVPAPLSFELKMDDTLADRSDRGLTANSLFDAEFNVAISCSEIGGTSFPQNFSLTMDLNVNDNGLTIGTWSESFEGGTAGNNPPSIALGGTKFYAENIDAGLPGNSNAEGLANSDGWRCQYNDPDWVNGSAYNVEEGENCFPNLTLAQSNRVYWQMDGSGSGSHDGGRAWAGSKSMYFGVFLDGGFTTPVGPVETAATRELVNLGVDSPELSFWHQISVMDNRNLSLPAFRNSERGAIQIKLIDEDGTTSLSDWMNLQPSQNAYDTQNFDFFFNCMYDPVDDGTTEDDFFDPTDPDRRLGPSSTCHPEFTWSFMGATSGAFNVNNFGNATTPPTSNEAPELGQGTWVKSIVDLSQFRGRRVHLRFLVTGIQGDGETFIDWFASLTEASSTDDGWWIDEMEIDDVLTDGFASIVNDNFDLGNCSGTGEACIGQCEFELDQCEEDVDCAGGAIANEQCISPCPPGESCSGPPPSCAPVCSSVTANAFVTPNELLNPASVATVAPGQVLTLNGAAPIDIETGAVPSSADACLSGSLQFRFCRDGDPLGGGPAVADGDCDDPADLVLRSWTENALLSLAPQTSAGYTMEVRCSTEHACSASRAIAVEVTCPGSANALGLKEVRAVSPSTLSWNGAPIDIDVWTSAFFDSTATLAGYPGTTTFEVGKSSTELPPDPPVGEAVGVLIKADGPLNTIPSGYFCNSKTWRSGGESEIDPGRDASIGDPTP